MKKIITTCFLTMILIGLTACTVCLHSYENGVCNKCGLVCEHEYVEGACSKCGLVCEHEYVDGLCGICGIECKHNYNNGVCDVCGKACGHEYVEGVCGECGKVCEHNYTNGVCSICEKACVHEYVEGVCEECGKVCEHTYVEGVCSECQTEDPNWVPADGGVSLYEEIILKYTELILYKYVNEELPPRQDDEEYYVDALYDVAYWYDPSLTFGYAYKDINNDGYVELFLLGRDSRLYGLFTIVDKKAAVVETFQNGLGYLSPDGMIFYNVKYMDENVQQLGLENHMTYLIGDKLVGFEYGWYDADKNYATEDDEIYYQVTEDGIETVLTYDEFKVYRDNKYVYYWDYSTRLTKLSGLKFEAVIPLVSEAVITADFSSYDAIIDTFGLMHSEVAGGKYVRTKWTGGEYDAKVIFESDEDFNIYNRLLGACVLVQNSSTAQFGYAQKDLNNDGTNELVLMDQKYNVFAIFTLVDNKPVLLETFTDLKTAFISADGLIHVKERVLPGNKKDFNYYLYEVGQGELICKLSIGVKCTTKGVEEAWHKTVNGVTTSIEQTEYAVLYATFAGDIGKTTYPNYTKANSGLTFTLANE